MDAIKCIMTRHSVRKYKKEAVDESVITDILKAGANAPSAGNQQPWHFVVVTDKAFLERIAEIHPHGKMLPSAAFIIIVCTDGSEKKYPGLTLDDCAAATQNMLLAAHAMGYGAVWVAAHENGKVPDDIKRILALPHSVKTFSIVSVGVPDESREVRVRLKNEMVHKNGW